MKHQTFTQYLTDICFKDNEQVLDDDMPDFFDNWLTEQDPAFLIEWGDKYGEQFKGDVEKKLPNLPSMAELIKE